MLQVEIAELQLKTCKIPIETRLWNLICCERQLPATSLLHIIIGWENGAENLAGKLFDFFAPAGVIIFVVKVGGTGLIVIGRDWQPGLYVASWYHRRERLAAKVICSILISS